jgi:serine phosphatase RsbU (regulator of sigma subunit)/anti-sigma regulatory factor (Ser/Thr protein kinase)
VLLGRITRLVEADDAAILLVERDGGVSVRATAGLQERAEAHPSANYGAPALVAAPSGRPHALGPVQMWAAAASRERPVGELLGVPLFAGGRAIGELQVSRSEPRPFIEEEVQLLQLAAERAAVAIEQSRVTERERQITATLQQGMLPDRLPQIPGVEIAARYCPGGAEGEVGGDWYEVIALADGRVAMAIGDVAGRGVKAAALMGQLRNMLRAYVLEGGSPADVLGRIDAVLELLGDGTMVTLALVVLDPRDWSVRLANAGHLPPLVVPPEGKPRFLEMGRSAPLGVGARRREDAEARLEPGATLVLYTDGLIERRDRPVDAGLSRLAEAASIDGKDADALCRDIFDELLESDARDDVALLVVKALRLEGRLELRVPAEREQLASVRSTLRRWLEGVGAAGGDVADILLACGEAAANAVEHAYGPTDADFGLSAEFGDGEVVLTIRDRGQWRSPRGENRGRGRALMEAVMDSVVVEPTTEGTTVVMRRCLRSAD